MNGKKCEVCRWYVAGNCRLPLYVDGVYYGGRDLPKEGSCELFEAEVKREEGTDAVSG